jgi:hypothetical protein
VYYVEPIIGFGFMPRGRFVGKSAKHKTDLVWKSRGLPREIQQKTLPRKTSKHNHNRTVPKTDTGDLVEKT